MITRVHTLEQEKVQLNVSCRLPRPLRLDDVAASMCYTFVSQGVFQTQNQVLRRELERVTALLREREARCVCLKGMPLSSDLRAESPVDVRSNRYDSNFTLR